MTEMRGRVLGGAVAILGSFAGVGCGAVGSPHPSQTHTAGISTSTRTSTSSHAASSAAHKLLLEAATALREAHGYAMRGDITDASQQIRLTASTSSNRSVAITIATGRSSEQLLFLNRTAYVRANEYFWRSQAPTRSRAPALANRWIAVPATRADALASSLGVLSPTTLARCLVEDHGSLSIATGSRIAGKPTLALNDAGNAPGASAGTLIIAAQPPHYPLRPSSTGNTHPGGTSMSATTAKAATPAEPSPSASSGRSPPETRPTQPSSLVRMPGQLEI